MLLLAAVDDGVNLVRIQLIQFAFFVVKARELITLLSSFELLLRKTFGVASSSGQLDLGLDILVPSTFCLQLMGLPQPIHLSDNPCPDPGYIRHQLSQPLFIELPGSNLGLRVQPAKRCVVKMRFKFRQVILSDGEHVIVLITEVW